MQNEFLLLAFGPCYNVEYEFQRCMWNLSLLLPFCIQPKRVFITLYGGFFPTNITLHTLALHYFDKMASASPEPHLEKLPLEIFLECMKLVPDVPSLTSCMTVSKKIRNDLTGNLSSICQAVITNEIGSDLLPIAICRFIAEHESSGLPGIIEAYANLPGDPSLGSKYEDCATRFFTKYLRGQAMNWVDPPSGFTLDTVQNLSKFHSVVCQFASRLINDIIPFMPDYGSHPVTPEERARFCKAIYTRELVALVVPFQNGQGEAHREVYKSFWRCFAPWESKQVLCVSNALIYLLSPRKSFLTRQSFQRRIDGMLTKDSSIHEACQHGLPAIHS